MTARYEQDVRAHALHQELAAIYTALADEHVLTTDSLLAPVSGLEFIVYYREQADANLFRVAGLEKVLHKLQAAGEGS